MKALKDLFDFYINSSIHLSIAVVCLTAVTYLNFNVPVDYSLLLYVFLASVTGYNFIKYAGIAKFHHFGLPKNLRIIQIFSFVVFIGLLISIFYQSLSVLIFSGIMGIFTGLYALPVLYNKKSLRGIPGLKIFIIAFVVAGVTVLMPLLYKTHLFHRDIWLDFLQRFFIVIVLVLPFEIRDLKYDMADLRTIPQVLGVRRTKRTGYVLIGVFLLLELFKQENNPEYVFSLLFLAFLGYLFLKNSFIRQGRYYASFWVEAVPIFWFLSLKIFTEIF